MTGHEAPPQGGDSRLCHCGCQELRSTPLPMGVAVGVGWSSPGTPGLPELTRTTAQPSSPRSLAQPVGSGHRGDPACTAWGGDSPSFRAAPTHDDRTPSRSPPPLTWMFLHLPNPDGLHKPKSTLPGPGHRASPAREKLRGSSAGAGLAAQCCLHWRPMGWHLKGPHLVGASRGAGQGGPRMEARCVCSVGLY